jgi:hypothetical protein
MRSGMERPRSWKPRLLGLLLFAGFVAGACGGAAATLLPSPSPQDSGSTPSPTPPQGPATAQLNLTGAPALGALIGGVKIQCNYPTLGGPVIVLSEQSSPGGPAVRVVVSQGSVTVRYSSGADKTYTERDFTGAGVTGFDAGVGAQFDSPLDELASANPTGSLGPIIQIQGSVDCGDQQPGTSSLVLTGVTPVGFLNGVTFNPVRVECDLGILGNSVNVVGVATVATVPTLFTISVAASSKGVFSVTQSPQTGVSTTYSVKATGAVTIDGVGVHIAGGATPSASVKPIVTPTPAGSPHKVTISGEAICGSTVVS